jgi:hypothetical protein
MITLLLFLFVSNIVFGMERMPTQEKTQINTHDMVGSIQQKEKESSLIAIHIKTVLDEDLQDAQKAVAAVLGLKHQVTDVIPFAKQRIQTLKQDTNSIIHKELPVLRKYSNGLTVRAVRAGYNLPQRDSSSAAVNNPTAPASTPINISTDLPSAITGTEKLITDITALPTESTAQGIFTISLDVIEQLPTIRNLVADALADLSGSQQKEISSQTFQKYLSMAIAGSFGIGTLIATLLTWHFAKSSC